MRTAASTFALAVVALACVAFAASARTPEPGDLAQLSALTHGRMVRVWTAGGSPLESEAVFSNDGACMLAHEGKDLVEAPPVSWAMIARVDVQRHRGWEGLVLGAMTGVVAWRVLANGDVDPRGAAMCAVVGPVLGGFTGFAVRRWQRIWPPAVHAHPAEWPGSGPPAMPQSR